MRRARVMRHCMVRALAICGALLGSAAHAQAPNGFSKARLARIDSAFDRWIADGRIAGIVALVLAGLVVLLFLVGATRDREIVLQPIVRTPLRTRLLKGQETNSRLGSSRTTSRKRRRTHSSRRASSGSPALRRRSRPVMPRSRPRRPPPRRRSPTRAAALIRCIRSTTRSARPRPSSRLSPNRASRTGISSRSTTCSASRSRMMPPVSSRQRAARWWAQSSIHSTTRISRRTF